MDHMNSYFPEHLKHGSLEMLFTGWLWEESSGGRVGRMRGCSSAAQGMCIASLKSLGAFKLLKGLLKLLQQNRQ